MSRKFAGLLRRAGRIAAEKQAVQQQLSEAFRDRYGCTYSDVDADEIIDVLDMLGGTITVAEADEIMARCGAPRIDGAPTHD